MAVHCGSPWYFNFIEKYSLSLTKSKLVIILLANFATACSKNCCYIQSRQIGLLSIFASLSGIGQFTPRLLTRWSSWIKFPLPDGSRKSVKNPLYHYKFYPIDPSFHALTAIGWLHSSVRPTKTPMLPTISKSSRGTFALSIYASNIAWRYSSIKYFGFGSLEQTNIKTDTYNMLKRIHTWPECSNITAGDDTIYVLVTAHKVFMMMFIFMSAETLGIWVNLSSQVSIPISVNFLYPHFYRQCSTLSSTCTTPTIDRLLSFWAALNPGVWVR